MRSPWCLLGASALPRPPESLANGSASTTSSQTRNHNLQLIKRGSAVSDNTNAMLRYNNDENWKKFRDDNVDHTIGNGAAKSPLSTDSFSPYCRKNCEMNDCDGNYDRKLLRNNKCKKATMKSEKSTMSSFSVPRIVRDEIFLWCSARVMCELLLLLLLITSCTGLPPANPHSNNNGINKSRNNQTYNNRYNNNVSCDLITGDASARAAAAAQVMEAEVDTSPPGNVYTAALTVRKALRRYRGPGRLKKQDVITLTVQREPLEPCVAVASLEVGKRYFVFMDAPAKRGVAPKAVAAPVLYTRRTRRLIRQEVCNKCGARRPPTPVNRLPSSDSVVRGHSVNFTCVFEGAPLPSISWYKDDVLIVLDEGTSPSSSSLSKSRSGMIANDVSASDSSFMASASSAINTNTMTITQRRARSRKIIRRRRRRRRRRRSGSSLHHNHLMGGTNPPPPGPRPPARAPAPPAGSPPSPATPGRRMAGLRRFPLRRRIQGVSVHPRRHRHNATRPHGGPIKQDDDDEEEGSSVSERTFDDLPPLYYASGVTDSEVSSPRLLEENEAGTGIRHVSQTHSDYPPELFSQSQRGHDAGNNLDDDHLAPDRGSKVHVNRHGHQHRNHPRPPHREGPEIPHHRHRHHHNDGEAGTKPIFPLSSVRSIIPRAQNQDKANYYENDFSDHGDDLPDYEDLQNTTTSSTLGRHSRSWAHGTSSNPFTRLLSAREQSQPADEGVAAASSTQPRHASSSRATSRSLLQTSSGGAAPRKRKHRKRKKDKNRTDVSINEVDGDMVSTERLDHNIRNHTIRHGMREGGLLRRSGIGRRQRVRPLTTSTQATEHNQVELEHDMEDQQQNSHHHNDHQHPQPQQIQLQSSVEDQQLSNSVTQDFIPSPKDEDEYGGEHYQSKPARTHQMETERKIQPAVFQVRRPTNHQRQSNARRHGPPPQQHQTETHPFYNETLGNLIPGGSAPGARRILRPRLRNPPTPHSRQKNVDISHSSNTQSNRTTNRRQGDGGRQNGSSVAQNGGLASTSIQGSPTVRRPVGGPFPANRSRGSQGRGTRKMVSSLSISVVEEDHAGVYKCVATSRKGTSEQKVQLSVIPPLDPGIVYPCPYDSFCLNGGTCMFFKFVGELVCQCVEGFKGQRCQEKEVYPTYKYRPRLILGAGRRRPRGSG